MDLSLLLKVERLLLIKMGFGRRIYTAQELILFILSKIFGESFEGIFEHNEKVRILLEYSKTMPSIYHNYSKIEMVFASVKLFLESLNETEQVESLRSIAEECETEWSRVMNCALTVENGEEEHVFDESSCRMTEISVGNYLSTSAGKASKIEEPTAEELCLSIKSGYKITEESLDFFLLDQTSKLEISSRVKTRTNMYYTMEPQSGKWSRIKRNKSMV